MSDLTKIINSRIVRDIKNVFERIEHIRANYKFRLEDVCRRVGTTARSYQRWRARGRKMGVNGRPRVLTLEQEQILLEKVTSEARKQKAMTATEVANEVVIDQTFNPSISQHPSIDWSTTFTQPNLLFFQASLMLNKKTLSRGFAISFLNRHPQLSFTKSREVSPEIQENCNEDVMNQFFSNLKQLMDTHQYHQSMIFNFDETMVQFLSSSVKVIVPSDIDRPVRVGPKDPTHITIGLFISADGEKLKPLLIFSSLKEFPLDAIGSVNEFQWACKLVLL